MRTLCCLLMLTLAGCGSKSESPAKAGIPLSIKSPKSGPVESVDKPQKEQTENLSNPTVEALIKKARAAVVVGQPAVAVEALSQAIGLSPEESRLFRLRGDVYAMLGQFANAKVDFSLAIKLNPDDAQLRNVRGYFLMSRGLTKDAMKDLEKALELDPNLSTAWNNMGLVELANKDHAKAEAHFTRALKCQGDYADAFNNRGFVRFKQQKYSEALADLQKAVELNKDYASAWNNIGLVHMAQNDFEAAVQAFTETIRLAPMDARWLGHRRAALTKLERFEEAVADQQRIRWLGSLDALTKASMQDARNPTQWIRRARHLAKGSEYGAAIQDYSRALAISPGNIEALNGRAQALLNIGELHKAVVDCDESLISSPTTDAYSIRGEAWMGLGNYSQAVSDLEAAQRFGHSMAEAYKLYATELRKEGDDEAAAKVEAKRRSILAQGQNDSVPSKNDASPIPEDDENQ